MQGVWTFANAAARDAAVTSPQEGNFCYLKDTNVTQYYTGSAWAALGVSKLVQVVMGTTSTQVISGSSTYATTGLTATITPTSASSQVLVLVNQNGLTKGDNVASNSIRLRLVRGSTTISTFFDGTALSGTALNLSSATGSVSYLDSPATTSATTYKTEVANPNNAPNVYVNSGTCQSTIILMEIGA
jgi:hypothetical protein